MSDPSQASTSGPPHLPTNRFDGLRLVNFESRLAEEMGKSIERLGGVSRAAPSMRELPIPQSPDARAFADDLLAGQFDIVIFLTGVGARHLMTIVEQHHPRATILDALAKTTLVVRSAKPLAVLRDWGLQPDLQAPAPNTWHEVVATLDTNGPLLGKRVAIQEYGETNDDLAEALRKRQAEVTSVSVYSWALPEDLEPLRTAIQAIVDGEAEVVTFTSAQQVRHLLLVAGQMDLEVPLRDALRRTVIGSVGPTTSATLRRAGLGVDFEPDRPKMGDLVRGLARSAGLLLKRKRASLDAGVDTAGARRVDLIWPADECPDCPDPLHNSPFMRACRREPVPYTPIWIMRQAGRYQREYRELREKVSFLEMCKRPELAAEVTLMAVDRLGVDAAIIFADILLIVEPMGVGLAFNKGEGPSIAGPVQTGKDIDALREVEPTESLDFVFEAIRMTRRSLHPAIPLLGFCGAPFTVASYMIEGGPTRDFRKTKLLMYRDPGAWHALMEHLVRAHCKYLNAQIDAGVQALQLFDSWVGCLSEYDYREFVLPHVKKLISEVKPGVPIIHFGTNTTSLLRAIKEAGGDVIGLDWRRNLASGWEELGYDVAVQGNLDPVVLFASPAEVRRRAQLVLDQAGGRCGHIFNLGHGVLPETPIDHVIALVDAVHEISQR